MRRLFLLAFAAMIATPVMAQGTVRLNPLVVAFMLMEHDRPADACALLKVVYGAETRNARALELMGECHAAQGRFGEAAGFFERALQVDPKRVVLRAKLAGIYLRLERAPEARAVMLQASAANPDSAAAARLSSLAAGGPVPVPVLSPSGHAEVSLMRLYDSNASGGSIASTVDVILGGVPLTLDIAPGSQAEPAWGTRIAASGSYVHPLDGYYSLLLRGDASATLYENATQYSRQTVNAGAGIVYRNQALTWSAVPSVRLSWEGGRAEAVDLSLDGRFNYQMDPQWSIIGAGRVGHETVFSDRDRDAWTGLAAAGVNYAFNPAVSGGVQLVVQRSAGAFATEAYSGIGPVFHLSLALTEAVRLDASYASTWVHFDQALGLFPQGRDDHRQAFGAALSFDLAGWREGLGAELKYNYQRTDSSISLYTSDRHLLSAGMKYRF